MFLSIISIMLSLAKLACSEPASVYTLDWDASSITVALIEFPISAEDVFAIQALRILSRSA